MDKIAVDINSSHLCSGRLGLCGAKQIVFSLLVKGVGEGEVEANAASFVVEPETPERSLSRRASGDIVAGLERQLRKERRNSQALEAEVHHWKGVADQHSRHNSRTNSDVGFPEQSPLSTSPDQQPRPSKLLHMNQFPDRSPAPNQPACLPEQIPAVQNSNPQDCCSVCRLQ
eukprot:GGOE01003697.1.p2 GENE.GGOE01003697.1~~GGOE01003697.1.p2  ORF type:complete len:172 (-),score=38.53 GGOE01003697.1:899-1414(-)